MRAERAHRAGEGPLTGTDAETADAAGDVPPKGRASLPEIASDLGSGVLVAFISAAYSLSFATLIFSGRLADGLSVGVSAMIFSAGVATAVAAAFSSFRFAVAGPDTATMAVVSAMAAAIGAGFPGGGQDHAFLVNAAVALTVTSILTGLVLFALGALKLGVWMRYIPYPVMGGFLAAAGVLLLAGAVKVVTGERPSLQTLPSLLQAAPLGHMLAGVLCAGAILLARRRSRHFLVMPAMLVAEAAIVYGLLAALGVTIAEARADTWLLPAVNTDGTISLWMFADLHDLDPNLLLTLGAEIAAAAGVTAVAILLTATGLEISARTSLDLNRELRVGGVSNLVIGLAGGVLGNLTLNRTLLNSAAGARTRLSGLVAGVLCIGLAAGGIGAVSYVPTPVLGGLLIYMGYGLISAWVIGTWRRLSRSEYVLVLAIMMIIVISGYLEGLVLGVIASCLIFALNYSRVRIIKHRLTRQQTSSYVDRSPEQQALLRDHGDRVLVLWLQGYLFFGTANGMLDTLMDWVCRPAAGRGRSAQRFLLLDFRQVSGADSSAVFSFLKLRNMAAQHRVRLAFSCLSPGVRASLTAEGVWTESGSRVRQFASLDLALEWAEEGLLRAIGAAFKPGDDFDTWLGDALGSTELAARFVRYLTLVRMEKGERLFAQGDPADALFFVRSGRISVILDRRQGEPIRLRSMTGYTVVGEMGLYRDMRRTAAIVADVPSDIYRLSKEDFTQMEATEPDLSSAFNALIVRILADRLSFATNEIAALLR